MDTTRYMPWLQNCTCLAEGKVKIRSNQATLHILTSVSALFPSETAEAIQLMHVNEAA